MNEKKESKIIDNFTKKWYSISAMQRKRTDACCRFFAKNLSFERNFRLGAGRKRRFEGTKRLKNARFLFIINNIISKIF